MHHLLANFDATGAAVALAPLPAIEDGIVSARNGNWVFQQDTPLLFAQVQGATLTRARLNSPSNRQVTRPEFRPILIGALAGAEPRIVDYRNNPFRLRGGEEQQIEVSDSAADNITAILGVDYGQRMMPGGVVYCWRLTSTTPAVANAWTILATTPDDVLPAGRYAVVGLQHISANAIAARLILKNTVPRPGAPSNVDAADQPSWLNLPGGLGVWGEFENIYAPDFEVLCDGADVAHTLFCYVIKVG